MKTPVGRSARNKSSRKNVGAPLWVNPDGSVQSGDGGAVTFRAGAFANAVFYAPYGKGNFGTYMREIVAGLIKEFVLTIIVCFLLPGFVSIGAGPDPVSRAIFIGLIAALSVLAALEWGYNERLPRFLTPGAQITAFLSGDINLWLLIAELVVGFAGATVAAGFLYGTGASAIPIIGTPNNNDLAGTFFVQLLFTMIIAYTVLDQKTTRGGYPRTFGKWPKPTAGQNLVSTPENPTPNRVYHEGFARRPYVYAAIVWLLVAFAFLKFGLWSFNAYIYYAGALALVFLGQGGAFTNQNAGVGTYVAGAGALFILVDVLAWILAMLIDWFMYWLHNNEYARTNNPDDDSSYGMVVTDATPPVKSEYQIIEDEYSATKNASVRNRTKKSVSNTIGSALKDPLIPIEEHLNSSHWISE